MPELPVSNSTVLEPLSRQGVEDLLKDDSISDDTTSTDDTQNTADDGEDLLADDKATKKDTKKEDKSEEKNDESEDELELEEPKDEDLELTEHVSTKAILAKYPTLFKDFPYLKNAYYREQQYTEIFPTLDDARESVERSNSFAKFENELLSGKMSSILSSVKGADEKAYAKIVDNYLPDLYKTDQNAFFHVLNNVYDNVIGGMVKDARATKNTTLEEAAVILNQWLGRGTEFKATGKFSKDNGNTELTEEQEKLNRERQEFQQERLNTVVNELDTRVSNVIKSTIAQNIDPKGVMPPYVKKNAINDAMSLLNEMISSDTRYVTIKDNLWKNASKTNFSKNDLAKIESAHKSKAKTLLRDVILKVRNEALKGLGKTSNSDDTKDRRGNMQMGRTTTSSSDKGGKSGIPKGMSNKDFIMSD